MSQRPRSRVTSRLCAAFFILCGSLCIMPACGCATYQFGSAQKNRMPQQARAAKATDEPVATSVRSNSATERTGSSDSSSDSPATAASLQAALRLWEEGDSAGSRKQLEGLLQRQPAQREARLLLAELCVAEGEHVQAQRHLRRLIGEDHGDARAHHALGLLLEETGRSAEAQKHLATACQLAPENELYRASKEGLARD